MRICGVDPGITTGLSLVIDREICEEFEADSLQKLWDLLYVAGPDVLVVESFLGTGQPINAGPAHEAIGICKLYAWKAGIKVMESNPSILQGKRKPRGISRHIWSARCHALNYLEKLNASSSS